MSHVVDSYSEANADFSYGVSGDPSTDGGEGQTFIGDGSAVVSAVFYMSKLGSPTGSCYSKLFAHDGVFGTTGHAFGTELATSDALDVSTITTGGFNLYTFTFSGANQFFLTNGRYYAIAFSYSGGSPTDYVKVAVDSSSPSHAGNNTYFGNTTLTWKSDNTTDTCFYVYGDGVAGGRVSRASSTARGSATGRGASINRSSSNAR